MPRNPQARCGTCRRDIAEFVLRDDEIICRECDYAIETAVADTLIATMQPVAQRLEAEVSSSSTVIGFGAMAAQMQAAIAAPYYDVVGGQVVLVVNGKGKKAQA